MIFLAQLQQFIHRYSLACMPAAAGTDLVDNPVVAANRISVHRMVDRTVSNAGLFHAADHAFKGIHILADIPVQLHIADMACIGQRVEGGFLFYLNIQAQNRMPM